MRQVEKCMETKVFLNILKWGSLVLLSFSMMGCGSESTSLSQKEKTSIEDNISTLRSFLPKLTVMSEEDRESYIRTLQQLEQHINLALSAVKSEAYADGFSTGRQSEYNLQKVSRYSNY